jgi:hypothetical protein
MLFKSHRLAFLVELPTDAFSVTPARSNVHFISTHSAKPQTFYDLMMRSAVEGVNFLEEE